MKTDYNTCDLSPETTTMDFLEHHGKELVAGNFLRFFIHELNNILGPILLYSELLQTKISPETSKKHLKSIEQSTMEARKILVALQLFVRKKKDLNNSSIEKNIQEILDIIGFLLRKKDIQLEINKEKKLPPAKMCSHDYTQVFFLLLLKVYYSMEHFGGILKLDVKRKNKLIVCAIESVSSESIGGKTYTTKNNSMNDQNQEKRIDLVLELYKKLVHREGGELVINYPDKYRRSVVFSVPVAG